MGTRILTIMFTDIKGFTSRTSEETRKGLTNLLDEHNRLLLPVFRYFDGTVVKTIGDAFLVYFQSPTDAVLCGVTIQEVLRKHNAAVPEKDRLEVRVAINAGEVELRDKDVLGEAVNIASRLEGITEAGEVYFTDAVYQTMNRAEAPSSEIGERLFKGIPHPIRVYKVIDDPNSSLRHTLSEGVKLSESGPILKGLRETQRKGLSTGWIGAIVVCAAAAAALAVWALLPRGTEPGPAAPPKREAVQVPAGPPVASSPKEPAPGVPGKESALSALQAARARLNSMAQVGEHAQALQWLKKEVESNSSLEVLRPEIALLDAKATVPVALRSIEETGAYFPESLKTLLDRYPQNPVVPYTAGEMLRGRVPAPTVLWLFDEALQRGGYAGDSRIFSFCVESLSQGRIDYDRFRRADSILKRHFGDRRIRWAREVLDKGGVLALRNAWRILQEQEDPHTTDTYYTTLLAVIGETETDMDGAFEVFRQQADPARRKHLIALHEEFIRESNFTVHIPKRNAVKANLEKLRDAWSTR